MKPTLRPATESDFAFAFEAKKEAMGPHISARWGWDENYQLAVHRRRWTEKPWFIISLNGMSIGTVSILEEPNSLRFGEFYLLTRFQHQGLGSMILSQVLEGCDKSNKAVRLEYLKWNPVGSLYKRHGFKVVSENDIHYFMVREPHSRYPL